MSRKSTFGQNIEKIHYHSKLRKRRFLDKNVEKWIFGQNDDKYSIFGKKYVENVEEVDFYKKCRKNWFMVKNF